MASFSSSTIYYSYCFSLPQGTSPYHLSKLLLKRGVALAAVSSSSSEVRLARQYKEHYKIVRQARALLDLESGKTKRWVWLAKNPQLTVKLLKLTAKRRAARKGSLNPSEEAGSKKSIKDSMTEAILTLEETVAQARISLGISHKIDEGFYAPGYLESDPFIRLELRPFSVRSKFLNDQILVFLLIHRSGVCVLTFATAPDDGLTSDDLIRISRGDANFISTLNIPLDLVRSQIHAEPPPADPTRRGSTWVDVEWPGGVSFSALFELHLDLLLKMCPNPTNRFHEWVCYPSIILNHLNCCKNRRDWLSHHQDELSGLLLRSPAYASLSENLPESKDISIDAGKSIYRLISHFVELNWDFNPSIDRPPFTEDHWNIALTENILIQFWQLRALDWWTSTEDLRSRSIEKLQIEMAVGLDEYRQQVLLYGTARIIAESSLTELGVHAMYERIQDRIAAVSAVVAAREARASGKRNTIIAGAAVIATLVLGLPSIDQSITLLKAAEPTGFAGHLIRPAQSFVNQHPSALWIGYFALCSCSLGLLLYGVSKPRSATRPRAIKRSFGIGWPGSRLVVRRSEGEYEKGRLKPDSDRG